MDREKRIKQWKSAVRIAAVVIAAAVIAAAVWLVCRPLVEFASEPELFRDWVDSHGILGRIAFVGMVMLQVVIAILPGEPFEIAAGYAFGALEGTLLFLAASAAGSIAVFLLVRRFGAKLAEVFFSGKELSSVRFLKTNPRRTMLFLIVFMLPGTPKDLLSYFAGLTDIRFGVWVVICSLGRIPSVVMSTVGGDALGTERYWFSLIVFLLSLAVSVAGLLIYNRIVTRHKSGKEEES